ncbi:cell envelope-related transcriptional attenuator [Gloeothece citriformis PCC 7424]|uniref:Cell envelope-related transcriptional attenuator n=1 Tax=Gloeothece citriformis (strain PCC 7424) TaxID=65393 RepID=B7K8T0_GLOC7|nr:LCP family protein [Gloeothece citriformis]ACK71278.1 cell envelope-related transcriptional attenuator [Gloeothece citriformis PCC 7424]
MSKNKTYSKSQPVKQKQSSPKKPKIPKKMRGSWILIGLGLTGVALVSATAGALLAVSLSSTPLRQANLSPQEEAVFNQDETISYKNLHLPELSRPVNILILGTKVLTSEVEDPKQEDLGYHALVNSFHGLTDTMLLLRFEPNQEKLTLLSIPRDTQTLIEGHGLKKINEANYYGGPALTAETVSNLLNGVPIDRYVRVNVQGVEKLIDALGGVKVYVPKDMKYQDDSQHLYINLKKGEQRLNGEQAVQFLRFRYDEFGDIGRIQRQQILIRALIEQALKPQTLLRIPDILSVIQSNIDTNLTVEELVALAGFAGQTQRSKIQMLMLPGGFSGDGKHEISYWIPYNRQIQTMVAQHFDHGYTETQQIERDPTSLRIAIQDSTDDPEAVQAMVHYLQEKGYRRIYLGDSWAEPLKVTRIIAQKGDDSGAAEVRATLGVGEVLVESTGNLASDLTIQLGKDWQEKQQMNLELEEQQHF